MTYTVSEVGWEWEWEERAGCQDVRMADRAILVPSRCDVMNLLKKNTEKIEKKTVNIRITLLEFTRTYPKYQGTGSGVPWCAKNENRTRTRVTRFGSSVGLPAPVFNPRCCIRAPILYNFKWFISHTSQPIFADNSNNFVSILAVFGDLSEK